MAKQPYIQFYLGDYIKDTRVLPLNVKGGWVDLILAMWDNEPKGELTGTIEDFARIMNCSVEEANLVIQTLKQKNIFGYRDAQDGQMQIISRKQKKMLKISESRKNTGKLGGNPILLNQNDNYIDKVEDKLIPEYENSINGNKVTRGGVGEKFDLNDLEIQNTIEFVDRIKQKTLTKPEVENYWKAFSIHNEFLETRAKVVKHFRDWLKFQDMVNGKKVETKPVKGKDINEIIKGYGFK
jgi:hypothetical protein